MLDAESGSVGERSNLPDTLPETDFSLLELADRLLHRGVVVAGEATISVAGIDLIYLGLNVVLSSVESMRRTGVTRESGTGVETP